MATPVVALVGRPNVGKSTLFNRLIGQRKSVTSDIPGTTRDRIFGMSDWRGIEFTVIDTGGIEFYEPKTKDDPAPVSEGSVNFIPMIRGQAMIAVEEADVILFLVDSETGLTPSDQAIAEVLRRSNKPIVLCVNKVDNFMRKDEAVEFYALGLGEDIYPVSAIHGKGTGDLLDALIVALKKQLPHLIALSEPDEEDYEYDEEAPIPEDDPDDTTIKIAILGRPNVGKSSLLNRILGEDRVIVSEIAGTTRDSVDTHLTWEGMPVTLVDTAGIRRRGSIIPGIEQFSVIRAFKSLERADVALLVIDASEGITMQDLHVGGMVKDADRSTVIVVNKWDAIEKDEHTMVEFTRDVKNRFDFLSYAPIVFVSAKTGQRIHSVLPTAARVQEERVHRIPTGELNQLLRNSMLKHAPSTRTGQKLKIYYGSQVRVNPPTFLFHVNDPELVHFSYERFLENQIRETYSFMGTPIRMSFRERKRNEDGPRKQRASK